MNSPESDLLDKIRQQFDTGPYPRTPIEVSPKEDLAKLYPHNLATVYYLRNKKIVDPKDKLILDAACGSGLTTLCLAEANPGAKIIGIDLSEKSLELARLRLDHHGFKSVEFYPMLLEDLPSLGLEFDYINANEVLYLLSDIPQGLAAMKAVLKSEGIIRTNLHSYYQRFALYRAQEIFKMMGLMNENPEEEELSIIRDFFHALKDTSNLKAATWNPLLKKYKKENVESEEFLRMNYVFQGDKGFIIPELFIFLEIADLDFIRMVNWRQWDLLDLFENPEDLPLFLALSFTEISIEEKLHLYELINPVHRLLDFWCGHPQETELIPSPEEWAIADWQNVTIHLHPLLKNFPIFREAVFQSINQFQPFEISRFLPITGQENLIDRTIVACLLPPLLESPQPLQFFIERWKTLNPVNPITLEPTKDQESFDLLRQVLINQEDNGYFFLEA